MPKVAQTGLPDSDSMVGDDSRREFLRKRRIWANRIIFIGKCFILILVLFLAYLLWTVRIGFNASAEKKYIIGQALLPFQLPPGYSVSFASDGLFSKIVVLDNPTTEQRIVLNRVYFRKDRTPDGFEYKFNHPGQAIKLRKSTFTGLENPKILEYSVFKNWIHDIPYIFLETGNSSDLRKGMICCIYCPKTGKSFYVESVASIKVFSKKDVFDFIEKMGACHGLFRGE